MGRHHMNDMDDFDEDEIGYREPSTRGRPQGRRDTGSGYEDKPVIDMVPYVPKGSRAGGGRIEIHHPGAGDSRAGGKYGARLTTDDKPDVRVPRCIRSPKPSTTNPLTPLHKLEAELDKAEKSKSRICRASQTCRKSDFDSIENDLQETVERIYELKNEIYKVDPQSERVDNTARYFLRLPENPDLESRQDALDRALDW